MCIRLYRGRGHQLQFNHCLLGISKVSLGVDFMDTNGFEVGEFAQQSGLNLKIAGHSRSTLLNFVHLEYLVTSMYEYSCF